MGWRLYCTGLMVLRKAATVSASREVIDTVVIGAGQAGLTASYHLSQRGLPHVVLERGRVGERWRSERWDNLHFQFPNTFARLPGFPYDGDDPDGFMHRDGIVRTLDRYAQRIAAPVRCGVAVRKVRAGEGGSLLVELDSHTIQARNVISATGPYQTPRIPPVSRDLPAGVMQLTANRYANADQLAPGAVLVVGGGSSGYQIAEDLNDQGRRVFLAVGRHRRLPRHYRGKDYGFWLEETGTAGQVGQNILVGQPTVLMSGYRGGRDVDIRILAAQGVRMVGTLQGVEGSTVTFAQNLDELLAGADQGYANFKAIVDTYLEREGLDALPPEPEEPLPALDPTPASLDLEAEDIRSVIWATGYTFDLGWVDLPVTDADGRPKHVRGVTDVPGFYFLGLQYLHAMRSAFFWGADEDAAYLAEVIAGRS